MTRQPSNYREITDSPEDQPPANLINFGDPLFKLTATPQPGGSVYSVFLSIQTGMGQDEVQKLMEANGYPDRFGSFEGEIVSEKVDAKNELLQVIRWGEYPTAYIQVSFCNGDVTGKGQKGI
jgi:hypothetical protein